MASDGRVRPDRRSRLDSWKEIAAYFARGVTTVQRWEREEGLPVHRLTHDTGSSIYAFEDELAEWHAARSRRLAVAAGEPDSEAPVLPSSTWRNFRVLGAIGAITTASFATIWMLPRTAAPYAPQPTIVPVAATPSVEAEPDLSRDGTRIVYVRRGSGPRHVVVHDLRTGKEAASWSGEPAPQFPQFSPDGKRVLYSRINDTAVELIVRELDSGAERRILGMENPAYRRQRSVRWAVWDASGRTVLVSRRGGVDRPYAIYRHSLDGRELAQLTEPAANSEGDEQCAASHDGKWIALVRYSSGTESDIFVIPSAGGAPRRLTTDNSYHSGVAWTPDSAHIVYSAPKSGPDWGLWRIPAGGGESVPITRGDGNSSWPAVSLAPGKGYRIAYTRNLITVNVRHWERPEQGGEPKAACPSTYFENSSQYSPDGRKLAYTSRRSGNSEIWTCDLDSGRAEQVTAFGGPSTDSARWSPDGSKLALTSFGEGSRNVYIADLASRQVSPLVAERAEEGRPSWSRDGQWIYFRSNRGGSEEIWKMPAGGGPARQITRGGAFEGFESADGKRLFFTKRRSKPGLWSVGADGGEERFERAEVREGWWSLTRAGVIFLPVGRFHEIWRYDPSTGKSEQVASITPANGSIWAGFAARWTGDAVAWSTTVSQVDDVVMLDKVLF